MMWQYLKTTRRLAAEAAQLRAWALGVLLYDDATAPPEATRAAWTLFLSWERCGALLQQSAAATLLPREATALLRDVAFQETRYILSARAQLQLVAECARQLGVRVLVLKGTADAARGAPVPITDVDVLAAPAEARALAAALDARGLKPEHRPDHWHLEPRTSAHALPIEVHLTVTGFDAPELVPWNDARPLTGYPWLWELAPHDHAWVMLNQAARKHPERRTRIRDLWLLRQAMAAADERGRSELQRRIEQTPDAAVMQRMLRTAESQAAFADAAESRQVYRVYLMQARRPRVSTESTRGKLWRIATENAAIGARENWQRYARFDRVSDARVWRYRRWLLLPAIGLGSIAAAVTTADRNAR